MGKYLLKKTFSMLIVLFIVSFITFFIIHLTPGDPARVMLGADAPAEDVAALRESMGLNRPLPLQYIDWLGGVLHGDFGASIFMKGPILGIILSRMQPTVILTLTALAISVLIAIPTGILAAKKRGRVGDQAMMVTSMVGVSIPNFLLGLLLVLLFAVQLKIFPASGYKPLGTTGFWDFFKCLVLPAVSLGLMHTALLSRMTRSAVLEVMNKDYIKMAKAKGVRSFSLMFRHTLRNAMLPIVTVIAQSFIALMAGALVTETIFNIPGIGQLVIDCISRRDYEVVQALVLLIAVINVLVMFLLDILYGVIDPRVRAER